MAANGAATDCEVEPIHIPGAVQPHGALLAALADGLLVTHASANLDAILGRATDSVLGRTLDGAIGEQACRALLEGAAEGALPGRMHVLPGPSGNLLSLLAHRTGRHVCIEIEPVKQARTDQLPIIMVESVLKTFEHAATSAELCELAVHGLKAISRFDRVMAYRFVEAGHGEVIAEAREAHLDPFLGLRYPASDIPPQARQLYLRQRVGTIADSAYTPVPLLADPVLDDGAPLDLTYSSLRSVSPLHREYMRNMNTAASLTIGLANGPVLWGMLVCHHQTPRTASPELRAAAGTLGQVVSLLLASLGESELYAQRLERNAILRALVARMDASGPLHEVLAAGAADILRLVDATGAMLRFSDQQVFLGQTPPPAAAERALAVLRSRARTNLLALDDLGRSFPELVACTHEGSGALLVLPGPADDDAILWFRPELSRTVTWGGNPNATAKVDLAGARMSPRASFAAWKETVRGRAAPWTRVDLALAQELRAAIQIAVAQRTYAALRESQAQLGLLAENSGVVVALSDIDGTRRYVSPAAERVLGWRAEDLVGHNALEFAHPDDHQVLRDSTAALLEGTGQSSATYRFRRPDGSWLWIDGHARLHANAGGEGPRDFVVVLRDATERKASELQLLEALERMEQMAATDGLTGLANRRHLDIGGDREWRRCARDHLPLSVLLLDADRFKLFNDRYGHLAGDDCLRAIAAQLAAAAQRPSDIAARYGGEEFLLLMPGTGGAGASLVAARLCRRIQDAGIAHVDNAGFGVATVSIGVATALPGAPGSRFQDLDALIAVADAALYRAKVGGRNQVVTDGGEALAAQP